MHTPPPASGRPCCSAHTRTSVASLLAITALLLAGAAPNALAQEGTVKAQHGDWQIVCKSPPPGAKHEICAAVQTVTDENNDNVGLAVYVQKFSSGEQIIRVIAPLGILLLRGLTLKVDDQDFGGVPFFRCHVVGCQAQLVLDDKLLQKLTTGKTAIFIIYRTEEAGIGIPISLAGFKDALAELK